MTGFDENDRFRTAMFEDSNRVKFGRPVDDAGQQWWLATFFEPFDLTPEAMGDLVTKSLVSDKSIIYHYIDGQKQSFSVRVGGGLPDDQGIWFVRRSFEMRGSVFNADEMFITPDGQDSGTRAPSDGRSDRSVSEDRRRTYPRRGPQYRPICVAQAGVRSRQRFVEEHAGRAATVCAAARITLGTRPDGGHHPAGRSLVVQRQPAFWPPSGIRCQAARSSTCTECRSMFRSGKPCFWKRTVIRPAHSTCATRPRLRSRPTT